MQIVTGEALIVAVCQRRMMNKNKTLTKRVNLTIPPSIVLVWIDGTKKRVFFLFDLEEEENLLSD